MKSLQRILFFLPFLFLLLNIKISAELPSQTNLYPIIAQENLKSLTNDTTKAADSLVKFLTEERPVHELLYEKEQELLTPSEWIKRSAVFNLLCQRMLTSTQVLDHKTWQDLELLCGPKSDPTFYLVSRIDRTYTQVGKVALLSKMVNPFADIRQLEQQQKIIKELVTNTKLFNELDMQLKKLALPETALLSFWAEDAFYALLQEKRVNYFLSKRLENCLNKNELLLELFDKIDLFELTTNEVIFTVGAITMTLYAFALASRNKWTAKLKALNEKLGLSGHAFLFALVPFIWAAKKISDVVANKTVRGRALDIGLEVGLSSSSGFLYGLLALYLPDQIKSRVAFRLCVQERLIHVATYLKNTQNLIALIKSNSILASRMPTIKNFDRLYSDINQTSTELSHDIDHLLDLLATDTFKGEASVLSYTGRIYAAFRLMHQLKAQFVETMVLLGEIDAQLSIAKLYHEFANRQVAFCFPDYRDPQMVATPSVSMSDFWSPFIDPEKVVPSSLDLGDPFNQPQNVIITGPNAGGKSTITKAFIIAIILAQSFGIAPARKMTFTPFNKIITYLNITDNIAAGNSHFKAGVVRAQEVEKTYKRCKNHEFVLTAIDEIFNGTTFKEGQAAAIGLLYGLLTNPLGMCITNTHFPLIPTLEQITGKVSNYKVSVIEKPGEPIQYPFKLERGISNQVITFKILKEEGFGDEFLDLAQQVLDGKFAADMANDNHIFRS